MGGMDVIQLHQHPQITHAKQHPVPHTGKSTANAVSMTTQPEDNRFYFFLSSVLNPNLLGQEKNKIFFQNRCLKIALRRQKSYVQCLHMSALQGQDFISQNVKKADAICNFGLQVCSL